MCAFEPGRYAAIDIGTVTCRLLVADVDEAGISHELVHGYRICNLGEGVDASGVLLPAAMERVRQAVAGFRNQIDELSQHVDGGIPLTCMATSASRDAQNAQEFIDLLSAYDVHPLVIPGKKEAALSFKGASAGFEGEQVLVVDIGGGSTEVVAGIAGEEPKLAHSFNIGCRRVTERFFSDDPPSDSQVQEARVWMKGQMEPVFTEMRKANLLPARMIAVAGTATTVVSVREGMKVYDRDRVHHAEVSQSMVDLTFDQMRGCSLEERKLIAGLDPGRAPVIVAGMVILQEVMAQAGVESYTVSESDILQGMVLDAASA